MWLKLIPLKQRISVQNIVPLNVRASPGFCGQSLTGKHSCQMTGMHKGINSDLRLSDLPSKIL